ncbi:DinB family protein [Pseudotamlana carrageenivorans]|uniref:DinB family protein n=1 Tax=Pseudotamlana carrageenivorans TaxID=2069432 RepID=A0A2I7SKM6_9FLAO|nr:DinB family protein [Tamlana carrageenivorans]AUS06430.1 DinB family protein [Tamlana carrageenivorans]
MKVTSLSPSEYPEFYKTYIDKVPTDLDLLEALEKGRTTVLDAFKSIPEAKLSWRYASGKWTIKEVFQHIIDTERVFSYRCFRISRRDKTNLPGFEQDDFVATSNANEKSLDDLIEAYEAVRRNTMVLLKEMSETEFKHLGLVSGNPMSARAAAFVIVGHEIHHLQVLQQKYL